MLNNNVIAPYQFKHEKREFLFHFRYAQVDEFLNQLNQLHRAASLSTVEQNDMIATIAYSRSKRIKFNPLWLDDVFEKIINECTVDEISPLVLNPGRILLSSTYIYFQPYNNIKSVKGAKNLFALSILYRFFLFIFTVSGAKNSIKIDLKYDKTTLFTKAHSK